MYNVYNTLFECKQHKLFCRKVDQITVFYSRLHFQLSANITLIVFLSTAMIETSNVLSLLII